MRTIRSFGKYLSACGVALAVVFCATALQAAPTKGTARITSVRGDAQFSDANGKLQAIVAGIDLPEGSTIKTGPNSFVYMAVNSRTSAVRVNENSVMKLEKLELQNNAEGDSDTVLDVQKGQTIGDIKKLSKVSNFDVRTPQGLAGIRGTAFAIILTFDASGAVSTVIHCINGTVTVDTQVNGQTVRITLTEGKTVTLTANQFVAPQVNNTDGATTITLIDQVNQVNQSVSGSDVIIQPRPGTGGGGNNDNPVTKPS